MSDTEQPGTGTPVTQTATPGLPAQPARPAYAAPERQSFFDRVVEMRAVIAVALAALIIGGLSGFILGEHTNGGGDRFGHGGPGGFPGGQSFRGPLQGQPPFGQGVH
jgi:hypothetical protein